MCLFFPCQTLISGPKSSLNTRKRFNIVDIFAVKNGIHIFCVHPQSFSSILNFQVDEMYFKMEGPWTTKKYCWQPWLAHKEYFWILNSRMAKTVTFWPWWQHFNSFWFETLFSFVSLFSFCYIESRCTVAPLCLPLVLSALV